MNPADSIKAILVTQNVAINEWAAINVDKEPDGHGVPHRQITIYNTGGGPPSPKWSLDYPSVQARVRGFPNKYSEARSKIQAIKDTLLGIATTPIPGNTSDVLVSVVCRGDIILLGFDSMNRSVHVLNFNMITQPAPAGNRIALV